VADYSKRKGKGKIRPRIGHEGPEGEQMCSSTLPTTSALDAGVCSTLRHGCFTPVKETRYPLYGGLPSRTVQPVASRYNGSAILANQLTYYKSINLH
jgi:hypothetical protein